MTRNRRFAQVDVFTSRPMLGNPVAVVLDSEDLHPQDPSAFARWTNLSESTFLGAPSHPDADYSVRIFTPTAELPFAGHPTLGSAHAWLAAGGTPKGEHLIQECAAGLITIRADTDGTLAFAAPPRRRSGPLEPAALDTIVRGLGLSHDDIAGHAWCDNGPPWQSVLLHSAQQVLALQPDPVLLDGLFVGVVGRYANPGAGEPAFEVRGFFPGSAAGLTEDPVTGSLNASVAQWLISAGLAPANYLAAQGSALGRAGRIQLDADGETVWVGGKCVSVVEGTVCI